MRQIRLLPRARADLDAIWPYTTEQWGQDQAEDYLRALGANITLLAAAPHLGRSIDDIRKGYFKFPAASHLLFYRLSPGAIEIIRILHKSMDIERYT